MPSGPDRLPLRGVQNKSLEHAESNVHARMSQVIQVISATIIHDITGVSVVPAQWPSLIEPKPIAPILEPVIPADYLGVHHVKRVALTEISTIICAGNAAILPATTVSSGLWLRLPWCVRDGRWLRLHLLGALRLRRAWRLLGTRWLLLGLRMLDTGRLRLWIVLRLRGVRCDSTLVPFCILRKCRKDASEK